jgi:hypothetical protein
MVLVCHENLLLTQPQVARTATRIYTSMSLMCTFSQQPIMMNGCICSDQTQYLRPICKIFKISTQVYILWVATWILTPTGYKIAQTTVSIISTTNNDEWLHMLGSNSILTTNMYCFETYSL